jgi:hypothetical protein
VVHFISHLVSGRRSDWSGAATVDMSMVEVMERRRSRYLRQVLPSPEAERLIEAYLASPDGQAETARVAARLRLSHQGTR